jgi:hypothetical protein
MISLSLEKINLWVTSMDDERNNRVIRGLAPTRDKAKPEYYKQLLVIGWREWLSLPELGIRKIKAKIDTGARTSSLHAYDIQEYTVGHKTYVSFKVHPMQRETKRVISAEAELVSKRKVKDSGGKTTLRPVIITKIQLGVMAWDIELTLVNRDEMGFRMLLGREALRGHLLVNPGNSFLLGAKPKIKGAE